MTIGFFFIWGVLGGGDAAFWREKEETDEMTGGKNEPFEAQHQKEHRFGWNAGSSKNFEISLLAPHTITNLLHTHVHTQSRPLPWFWTTEDVISHISKVWEETRDCSPFRNAGILSLRRNISSWAHYDISLRQYWKQHVSSVSLCLSLTWPQRWR